MTDKLHPDDVGPTGRIGNDPIRKAETYAHLARLEQSPRDRFLSKSPLGPNPVSVPFVFDAAAVRRMLAEAIGAAGTQAAFAQRHGMSGAYLSEVVRGTRDLGPSVLEALGLERVVGYRRKNP